jgi:hypothetical protein
MCYKIVRKEENLDSIIKILSIWIQLKYLTLIDFFNYHRKLMRKIMLIDIVVRDKQLKI